MGSGGPGVLGGLQQQIQAQAKQKQLLANPPPAGPDLTDKAIQAQALQQLGTLGRGRKSTFLTGPAPSSGIGG